MKLNLQNIGAVAERYIQQQLSPRELAEVELQLRSNELLNKEWKEYVEFFSILNKAKKKNEMTHLIQDVMHGKAIGQHKKGEKEFKGKVVNFKKYLKLTGIAAAIAIGTSITTYYLATNSSNLNASSHYRLLSREIQDIKKSQNALIQDINKENTAQKGNQLIINSDIAGTSFAISNNGYLATDYHVVNEADSIFIQYHDGNYYKAYVVAFEPTKDVAILKIEDEGFKFSKNGLPYRLASKPSELAQTVFSVGFPQDNIVYNEGYISSLTGYNNDQYSYQLDITANPGQSGAPVFDHQGNVIALVTAKETNATYAIHTNALLDLIHSLPNASRIQLSEGNKLNKLSRVEQVKKLHRYVYAVKVFK